MSRPRARSWNRPRGATTGGSWPSAGGGPSGCSRCRRGSPVRLVSKLAGTPEQGSGSEVPPRDAVLGVELLGRVVRVWDPIAGRQLLQCEGYIRGCYEGRFADRRERGPRLAEYQVVPGREVRVLHHGTVGNQLADEDREVASVAFDADGQVLATGGPDGVRFWDLASGAERAWLPLPGGCTAQFVGPDNRATVTHGSDRVLVVAAVAAGRWEVDVRPAATALNRPREQVHPPVGDAGRRVGVVRPAPRRPGSRPAHRRPRPAGGARLARSGRSTALSPDGRFVALSGWR